MHTIPSFLSHCSPTTSQTLQLFRKDVSVTMSIGKVRKRLAMLGRIRKNINMYTAGTVYTSFVLPILDYCDTVWSCCGSVNTDKLEKLQRRAARIVMRLRSSEKALNFLGYVTLEKRRESHVRNLVKKCLSNRCPQFFMHYLNYNRDVLPRRTRSSDKLRLPSVKLECTKNAFFIMVVLFLIRFGFLDSYFYMTFYSYFYLYLIIIIISIQFSLLHRASMDSSFYLVQKLKEFQLKPY